MLAVLLCFVGVCSTQLLAQTTYSISGAAYYSPGKYNYLPDGAQIFIKLINPTTNTVLQVVRADGIDGSYTLNGVANGTYTVIASTNNSTVDTYPVAPKQYPFLSPASGSRSVTVNGASQTGISFQYQFQCTCSAGAMISNAPLPPGYSVLTTNGDMSGWAPFTENLPNVSCDSSPDRDGNIQSTGRNLIQFTWTWDGANLYGFTIREASESNTDNFIYYADVNNNGIMEATDPVIYVGWQGSNRTVSISIGRYTPANPGGDPMNGSTGYADGYSMPGTISWVRDIATADYGSQSGIAMQWYVPWSALGVAPGTAIRWHISSLNSTVTAGSLTGQIDDNMGGCGGCVASSQIGGVSLTPTPVAVTTQANTPTYIAHVLKNTGNGADSMTLSYTATGAWTPTSVTYYRDLGTVGQYDPGVDQQITGPVSLTAGASIPILVAVTPPASASGVETVSVKATSAYIPPCGGGTAATATATDAVTVVNYSINGTVYVDANHNSTLDNGEGWSTGPQQMFVLLYSGSSPSGSPLGYASVATGGAGTYTFPNLTPGTYSVLISTTNPATQPSYQSSYPTNWVPTEHSGVQVVTVSNAPVTENFGLYSGARITGVVFIDNGAGGGIANNGVRDGGEGPISGVTVNATSSLQKNATVYDSTITDPNGVFTLFVPSGTVYVNRQPTAGYIATWGSVGTTSGSYSREYISFNASVGAQYSGLAFGDLPPNTLEITGSKGTSANTTIYYPHIFTAQSSGSVTFSDTATTSGWSHSTYRIYQDTNCNSVIDNGEPLITAPISFPRAGGQPSSMQICILVEEAVPPGINAGTVDTLTVTATENYTYSSPVTAFNSTVTQTDTTTVGPTLSGTVFADANHNGIFDAGEIGTNTTLYVKAFLNGTGTASIGSVNPDTGSYSIPVSASGTYLLVLSTNNNATSTTPSYSAGWIPTSPTSGTISGATSGNVYNFGLFNGSTLAGTVFTDNGSGTSANNGQINAGEPGYAGMNLTISYSGGSGSPQTATTDSNGSFSVWIPGSVTSVTVTRPFLSGYLGTGGAGGSGGAVTGTYTRGATTGADTVTISALNGVQYSGIRFGIVSVNTLINSNSGSAGQGTTIYYPHEFTAGSAVTVAFSATGTGEWPEVVLYDQTLPASCSSTFTSNFVAVPASISVTTNQKLCLLVQDSVPLFGAGTNTITLVATETYSNASPALSTTITQTDITTVLYQIAGTVYSDANHNLALDAAEGGTGQTLFVKLVPQNATAATSVATVNTGTGAGTGGYVLYASPGTYRVVLSTNNSLSDIAPIYPSGWLPLQNSTGQLSFSITTTGAYSQDFGLYHGSTLSGTVFVDTGAGGGTANNGIKEPGESGLATVTVTATNGATSYDSATTAADGSYTLFIPSPATTVTITRVAQAGYFATGGNAGTTGGTYTRAGETVAFTLASGTTYTGVNFGDVPVNTLSNDGAKMVVQGGSVYYPHTFVAGSAGTVTFSTAAVSNPPAAWVEAIYIDSNCNQQLDAGELLATPQSLATGGTVCVLVKETAPSPATGQDTSTLSAAFTYANGTPELTSTVTRSDVSTIANGTLTLAKMVDKTRALPGETITYTVVFTNTGQLAADNIVISDSTPASTKFVSASCGAPLPQAITACTISAPAVGGTGSVTFNLSGSLSPGATGNVVVQVSVD